jgi:hypothetical protein
LIKVMKRLLIKPLAFDPGEHIRCPDLSSYAVTDRRDDAHERTCRLLKQS